ncbi:MAG: PPOX class F420-dependent oxidoreductase [Thermoleophilia bacterium]|nr:PPOX class F420-dependent oxidoreductase [Thermoleophilia bacterium]
MTELTSQQRAFLESPFVGVATTLREDGSPHSTVVWVDVDDEGVSFNTAWPRAKPRHLAADPRLSLVVVDPDDAYRWIAIEGRARLVEEGANEQIDRLARKYLGRDSYPWHRPDETRVSVRIEPTRIESHGL